MNARRRSAALTAIVLAVCSATLLACGLAWKRYGPVAVREAHGHVADAGLTAERSAASLATRRAIDDATERLARAMAPLSGDDPHLALRALLAAEAGASWDAVERLLPLVPDDDPAATLRARARLHLARGAFDEARELAWRGADAHPELRATFVQLAYDTVEHDPVLFSPSVHTLVPGEDVDRLERLGGGSTITLKMKRDGETIGVFKPWQTRLQSNYRAELAAYRLCPLIRCGFAVPTNREVRLREQDLLALYGIRRLDQAGGYAGGFTDLVFFPDEDGVRWLHATQKAWVPGFTRFPVETTSAWAHLVSRRMTRERLESMELSEALDLFRTQTDSYRAILERADGLTALDLARQLSNLHVFDHLINNWDRYSGAYPGVNCQFHHGRFVSIDNGASFQARGAGNTSDFTTWSRLRRIELFSRTTVDAIRWMDLDRARALLFPPSPHHLDDDDRWERFLARRLRLLEHIDQLIAEHGEDRVLALP